MSPTSPPYPEYKLALLGFGNVGQAMIELLIEKKKTLQDDLGIYFKVVGAASGSHGIGIDPRGYSLEKLLISYREGTSLDEISHLPVSGSQEFIQKCGADVLFETTPVNYQDGQPALDYIKEGIKKGMHVITSNKGPVVHGYQELTELAQRNGVSFFFESAVMDGAPVFSIFRCGLPGAQVKAISGIFNSTTNLILTRMETGETLEEAIRYAQSIGIAETDPSGDVDGWDAAVKVAALVTVFMDKPLKPDQVERTGIRGLTPDLIKDARENGKRWKLVCYARLDDQSPTGVFAKVHPEQVDQNSPFYNIMGTTSILQVDSDVLGELSLIEKDPSPKTTAYGLLADFLNAVQD
jgi:homoserine dehydrogenase